MAKISVKPIQQHSSIGRALASDSKGPLFKSRCLLIEIRCQIGSVGLLNILKGVLVASIK